MGCKKRQKSTSMEKNNGEKWKQQSLKDTNTLIIY